MDYTKYTKQELIDMLLEKEHLAAAVEAKDEDIVKLNKKLKEADEHLAATQSRVKKEQEDKVLSMEQTISTLKERLANTPELEKVNEIVKENTILIEAYNKVREVFLNYMKSTQATLENTIELEYLLTEKTKNLLGGK